MSEQYQNNYRSEKKPVPNIAERVPPQAVEVEKSVLASALLDEEVLDSLFERVTDEKFFYSPQNRTIFDAMKSLHQKHKPVDLNMLAQELRTMEKLELIGGEVALAELVTIIATSGNVNHYITILEEKMILRSLIHEAGEITTECFESDANAKEVLDGAEQKIFDLSDDTQKNRPVIMKDLLKNTFDQIEEMSNSGGVSGLKTGFDRLDELTTGFHGGELIIIAARPGMGKTAFVLSLAANVGIRGDSTKAIALFSLEMPKEQLVQRMLCSEARVDMHKLRGGNLSKGDMSNLMQAAGNMHESPIYVDDSGGLNVMELRSKCRRIKSEAEKKGGSLGVIIIDYLQLMSGVGKQESRQLEISSISRNLKEISKELRVPVIALAQLSRAVEQRAGGNNRPMLSDLRESGAIEQDADLILFLYREAYYLEMKKETDGEDYERIKNVGEVIIGKQRNGPLENISLSFVGRYTRFDNLAPEALEMPQEQF
jgi:replicative DNA helicase